MNSVFYNWQKFLFRNSIFFPTKFSNHSLDLNKVDSIIVTTVTVNLRPFLIRCSALVNDFYCMSLVGRLYMFIGEKLTQVRQYLSNTIANGLSTRGKNKKHTATAVDIKKKEPILYSLCFAETNYKSRCNKSSDIYWEFVICLSTFYHTKLNFEQT